MKMITSGLLATFLVSSVVNKSHDSQVAMVDYYQELLGEFMQNASIWQHPTSSRHYFDDDTSEPEHWGDFDFIIVGAGSSGSVLTNRLTESGRFRVLVLEAGGYENDISEIPIFAGFLMNSDFNWGYRTVPQTTSCLGMNDHRCNYPRGKAVGGSSAINYMVYARGNKADFDEWAARGNPGWDYDSVLPYFRQSENSQLSKEDCKFHGHDGFLNVENVRYSSSLEEAFFSASEGLGRTMTDYNGKVQIGFSHMQSTTINGRRCSGAKAFIRPILNRQNLELVERAFVLKVLIEDNKATGVEFVRHGKRYQATASKEVVLSAGAINSPQLLMLSGIGPRKHLEELDIPVIQNLPVGKTLADHHMYFGLQFTTNITIEQVSIDELLENYLDGHGPLTAAAGAIAIAFMNNRVKESSDPNIEYMFTVVDPEQAEIFATSALEINPETWTAVLGTSSGKMCWHLVPILLHPLSRGTLRLQSKDPFDFPLIDLNMLSDPDNIDIEEMLNAVKDIFQLAKSDAFQSFDSKYLGDPLPGCLDFEHLSDEYWRCALRQLTTTIYHPVATCKMGPPHDGSAVVNDRLKVYGVESLRVIDASIIPFSLACHTNAVCYMIGEKGADLIRLEYEDK